MGCLEKTFPLFRGCHPDFFDRFDSERFYSCFKNHLGQCCVQKNANVRQDAGGTDDGNHPLWWD